MLSLTYISIGILVAYTACIVRLISILPFSKQRHNGKEVFGSVARRNGNLYVFVFLGSGGHTGEMMRILQNYHELLLSKDNTLLVGYSDSRSKEVFQEMATKRKVRSNIEYYDFIKAREVNASIIQSFFSVLKTLFDSFIKTLVISSKFIHNPHLILLNGPGTCCILALWFKFFEFLNFFQPRSNIVYIESLARISSLSLSGKILYWLADSFIVQWEELKKQSPRAEYFGILV